jgi:hypothetical protein
MPEKTKTLKKEFVVKPIQCNKMNSRCQVDLIDVQSNPDRDTKFILVYQDHITTFVLRSLHSKRADEVASSGNFHNFWGAKHSPLQQREIIL